MPRLSLCLIVRNAERDLERCLVSAREVADEIVVVDTGSVDGTARIARAYAHHYAEYAWHDDFAAARNASLALATGDWLLVLDADEELDPKTRHLIRPALEADQIAAYQLVLCSLTGPGTPPTSQFQFRLFRNDPALRYTNPIHEQIVDALPGYMERTGRQTTHLPAIIIHHGYQEGYNPHRAARNRRLLRKALRDCPDDPYYLYKLARELRVDAPEESAALQTRAVEALLRYSDEALSHNAFATEVLANEIQDCATRNGTEEALELCEQAIRRVPAHPLLFFLRGALLWRRGQYQTARTDLELCLAMEDSPTAFTFYYDAAGTCARANAMLGELYFQEGFYNRAETCFGKVLELSPGHSLSLAFLLRIRALKGDAAGALRSCVAWVQRTGDVEAMLLMAELLLALNRKDTARLWLKRVEGDFRESPEVSTRVAQLLQMLEEHTS